MAANLLVRRSTAGLLRLVRSQAATFATERPSRSDIRQLPKTRDVDVVEKAISAGLQKHCRKYNLVKDTSSIDEILDSNIGFQNFLIFIKRSTASEMLCSCKRSMMDFRKEMIIILFWDHIVNHCSCDKIHVDEALKFKEAFSLPSTETFDSIAKDHYTEPPCQSLKRWRLNQNKENKIKTRKFFKKHMSHAVMREIEEDIMKIYQEITDGQSTEM